MSSLIEVFLSGIEIAIFTGHSDAVYQTFWSHTVEYTIAEIFIAGIINH